jgi:hypothetical protein
MVCLSEPYVQLGELKKWNDFTASGLKKSLVAGGASASITVNVGILDPVLTYFLNGVREQENSFTLNMDRRELYIGANNSGSEKFYCRVKRLQIRVYDNSHFFKPTLVTDVWRYRIKERSRYLLKSTERNNYLIECNYAGNYTTRVKEGHFLPTGLVLRSNRITGNSDLTNNLTTTIELLINGTLTTK